ncbi:hypothetical protein BD769DRAFT_1367557 [Suillus cothurnatus]|nr:hypothetical protein BD769DRAFT_1367557 [Suillus cothurnatus]
MSSACHADGSLKDASEIEWYNDAKDNSPMVPPPALTHNGTLNMFIHCSCQAVKPTEKIRETLTASSTSAKRSALEPPQDVPATKQVFIGDNDDDKDAPALEDVMDDEEEDAKNAENEEAYQWTKKLSDQDHEDCKSLKKDKYSIDLTTVFTFEKGRINPHTQDCENGWWCEVCKANNVPLLQCFFKGGISTQRTHIARHPKCHYPVYHDHCKEQGIKMHNPHYIDSPIEKPHEWELKMEQLTFTSIHGNHSSMNIRRILIDTINNYGICAKVGWFTVDNTTNNDTAIETVANNIDPYSKKSAKHFMEEVAPMPVSTLHKNAAQAHADDEDEDEESVEFDIGDTIGKALTFVSQGVNRFIQLTNDSDEVPNLQGGKSYADFKLSAQEWTELEFLSVTSNYAYYYVPHNKEPAEAQQSFSVTCEPTVWQTIPVLEYLQETLQNMAGSSKFSSFLTAIEAGIENLCKWYGKTDDTNVAYAKDKWDPHYFDEGM